MSLIDCFFFQHTCRTRFCQLEIHQNTVRNNKFEQSNFKAAKGSISCSIFQNKTIRWLVNWTSRIKLKNNNRSVLIKFKTCGFYKKTTTKLRSSKNSDEIFKWDFFTIMPTATVCLLSIQSTISAWKTVFELFWGYLLWHFRQRFHVFESPSSDD